MIDFSREYSVAEFDSMFDKCPYCDTECVKCLHNDDSDSIPYVQYNFCVTCNFAARFFFIPAFIDLLFNVNDKRHINIIVSSKGVHLTEREKILKVLSTDPITDLKELKNLIQKYTVLL